MSDVNKDWTGITPTPDYEDPTKPASASHDLVADDGQTTPPGPVAAAGSEPRSFVGESAAPRKKASVGATEAPPATDAEPLLRASLETIKVKADELRGYAKDWSQVRGEQARQIIDERPVTSLLGAFGAGLLLGVIFSRR